MAALLQNVQLYRQLTKSSQGIQTAPRTLFAQSAILQVQGATCFAAGRPTNPNRVRYVTQTSCVAAQRK